MRLLASLMASATCTLRPILQLLVADSGVLVVARRMLGIVATIAFPNQLLLRLLQLTREDDFRYHARALDVVYRGVVTLDRAIEYFVGDDLVQHCEGTNNERICTRQPPPWDNRSVVWVWLKLDEPGVFFHR